MKQKKSTIRFLKNVKKNATNPAKNNGTKVKTNIPKKTNKPKTYKKRDDDAMDDVESDSENEKIIKMPKTGNKKHKDELKGLEETDPEFFNYLKKNDTSLLDFDEDEEDEEDDDMGSDDDDDEGDLDLDEESDEDEMPIKHKKAKKNSKIDVTSAVLSTMAKGALSGSLVELKKLLSVFRTACIPNDDATGDEDVSDKQSNRYLITSPEVYELVMTTCIDTAHRAFRHQLDMKQNSALTKEALQSMGQHSKWKKIQLLVLSFFKSILHTLSGLADSSQQSQVSVYLIESLEVYIPFLSPLPRLSKNVCKVLLTIWSFVPTSESGTVEETLNVRGHAFLRIRQMSLMLPGAIAEECFRSMYLKFARQCKHFNEMNATSVNFMSQCVAELYATDPAMAYQQAFLYIRQLALHLRTAFLKKSTETTRQITSWQFLNCLRLWTRVLCVSPSEENGLGALAFPLIQVMFGVMTAAPSVYMIPLKFHLIACLHQLAAHCKLFVPTASHILEILEHNDLVSKPTPSTELAPKLQYLVKLPTDSITRVVVRDTIVAEAVALLRQDIEVYRFHVGLPEYAYLSVRKLKAFAKKSKVPKWRDLTRTLTGQIEQYMAFAKKGRILLGKPPMAITDFEPLLTPGAPTSAQRLSKLLTNNRGDGEINVTTATTSTKTSDAQSKDIKDFLRQNYATIKENSKKKNKKDKKGKKSGGRHSDSEDENSDDDDEGSGSELNDYESGDDEDVMDSNEEDSDEDEDEDEDGEDDESNSEDEVIEDISGLQDSVGDLSWADDE